MHSLITKAVLHFEEPFPEVPVDWCAHTQVDASPISSSQSQSQENAPAKNISHPATPKSTNPHSEAKFASKISSRATQQYRVNILN